MKTTFPPVGSAYAVGYTKGRHAAKEHFPAKANPYRPGTAAHSGWSDGHYDAESARRIEIARHSAEIWGGIVNAA